MDPHHLIVLTPNGAADSAIAIAACRAGAMGTLDLEYASAHYDPSPSLSRLAEFGRRPFGVLIRSDNLPLISRVLAAETKPAFIILAGRHPDELGATIDRIRTAAIDVLREATSVDEARLAIGFGIAGLVLKGHESGGRIGPDTSFVLLQKWRGHAERHQVNLPYWVRGGIGPNTAAACLTAGARGVVLDSQVLLAREARQADPAGRRVAGLDGSETAVLGTRLGESYRVYNRPDCPAAQELISEHDRILGSEGSPEELRERWNEFVRSRVAGDPASGVWLIGQDVALASPLAARGVTVSGIVQAICDTANELPAGACNHLAENGALAKSHGTKYPILQGPMTRVSDTAAFAAAVATDGALPFLALALLRKNDAEQLLRETSSKLGSRPWGVGILGFVPDELRAEQLEVIRERKPPFAIIAGGRPDQAKELEAAGIRTYLHVPSPGLLRMFLKDGARRFIFEGQECGGHIGPRTSFALWETMIAVLNEFAATGPANDLHVIFAGGIHDGLSAGMVAALSAGLARKGVKVGVLVGTAYLFTKEAVSTGAITKQFQLEALNCAETVLLESRFGHAIRCIPTPYAEVFESEKRRMRGEGKNPLEIGLALERMNLGRLRVASKGVDRAHPGSGNGTGLSPITPEEQVRRGMYMIGQVAALRNSITTIAELHADICRGVSDPSPRVVLAQSRANPSSPPPCDVAVIGLSCFFPRATSLMEYWHNILAKVNAVIEIPASHWDWRPYYDPDPRARDKMISKWGGFMSDVLFDPLKYGITPKSIPSIEPLQLLLLEAVNQALGDAGYLERPFNRERTCAILGVGGGGLPLSVAYGFRACMPLLDSIPGVPVKSSQIIELGEGMLPEWTEDSFPGILLNVAAGRVANRFNLGGPNMAIDAACGSSLAALYAGVRELNDGTSDVAIVMGGDAVQTPYAYVAFSKTHALSPRGRCRPFDAGADGIALAEGVGVAVLKRLADAERDGDRIYAVIKGVGASSDGRDKGLTAPRAEGQLRALDRAYAQARVSPARVGLVEAHGTGTVVGDQTEARAIGELFRAAGGQVQSCAFGSVKSMIGHSKCAAGLAGLIKTALALHHKVLPPTLVEAPNPKANLDGGPLFLNTEARPWIHGGDHPRTAGVSAFGFGGTNFHTVLEEYTGDYLAATESGLREWPAELFVWRRADESELLGSLTRCRDALAGGAEPSLGDLGAAAWETSRHGDGQSTLAIVATSIDDLKDKLDLALASIPKIGDTFSDPRGVYFARRPQDAAGRVAFLFPGQGSQYPNMIAQTAMVFPEVREVLDRAERTLANDLDRPLGRLIYPPSAFTPEQDEANRKQLQRTEVAQPAVGAASIAMYRLLTALGVEADYFAGHSYGEYSALAAAGAMAEDDLIRLSYRRGRVIKEVTETAAGGMIAVDAPKSSVHSELHGISEVWIANLNAPNQLVIAGTESGLKAASEKLHAANIRTQRIPVACGFHSPLIGGAKRPLSDALAQVHFAAPRKPVYSNTTAAPHDFSPEAIARQLADHLLSPVRFAEEVEALYAAGARVFVEVGPQAVLASLTGLILAGRPHLAVATDVKSRPGLVQLAHALGQLFAAGVPLKLDRWFRGRAVKVLDLATLNTETGRPRPPSTAWVVNGVRSRPVNGPEPRLLGQALPESERSGGVAAQQATGNARIESPAVSSLSRAQAKTPRTVSSARVAAAPAVPSTPRATMNDNEMPTRLSNPPATGGGHHQVAPEGAAAVMLRFQDVMNRFLETQRSVMLAYLGSGESDSGLPTNGYMAGSLNGIAAPGFPPAPLASRRPESAARTGPVAPPLLNGQAPTHPETNGKPDGTSKHELANEKPTDASLDRETLLARLLELVSDRTGYPKEALSIDLDLEADLGIDSIKRVEILGALAESIGVGADGSAPAIEMEKLSVIKTLRGISDYMIEVLASNPPEPSVNGLPKTESVPGRNGDLHPGAREGEVQRLVVELVDVPLPLRPRLTSPPGAIVITDDRQGSAQELADRLAELDVKSVLVRNTTDGGEGGEFSADLTNPEAVADLLSRLRQTCGPVSGLIHLLPLAEPIEGDTPAQRAWREVKSLYLLARGLEADIRGAGKSPSGLLLAVTAMGGRMGYGQELPNELPVGHGGVAGFTKSLAHEWPEALVRSVDVDGETPATQLAERLLAELGDSAGPFEVGLCDDCRVTWQVKPGPLAKETPVVDLGPDSTIVVTGGARGITAKVALELARRYQAKLVLVGSSAPPATEPEETRGLTGVAEIKAALLAREPDAKPAAIESTYRRLLKDREIRANLAAIREAGSAVDYRAVDVRDGEAFGALLEELNAAGGVTGVIHGAGVIEDRLLRDKTPESFDRVFGTKVESALTLARKLDPGKLKFLVLFASITSRYGNRGQADYAAANEVLSKLACDLDRRWPARVVSVAWGPWSEVGMVAELEKHLVARGLKLIEPSLGAAFAVDEVVYGTKGQPEVLIAGGSERAAQPARVSGTKEAHTAGVM